MDRGQFLCGVISNEHSFQKDAYEEQIKTAARYLMTSDLVLIGAGAGLSAAAGLTYSGKRFRKKQGGDTGPGMLI